jgi:hypothetical protein
MPPHRVPSATARRLPLVDLVLGLLAAFVAYGRFVIDPF